MCWYFLRPSAIEADSFFQEKIAAQDQLSKEMERNEILLKQNQKFFPETMNWGGHMK